MVYTIGCNGNKLYNKEGEKNMADAYLGEIRMFSGNYAPQGWALCNGQTLQINGNEALYSLLGVVYGGDGQTTFALPDLRGRLPIHISSQYPLGNKGGTETVTITAAELPTHTHLVGANSTVGEATQSSPENNVWGVTDFGGYQTNVGSGLIQMNPTLVEPVGSNLPHDNMMPSLTINFIIATVGLYPTPY